MEIKVERIDLISILKENMKIHQNEYIELTAAFFNSVAIKTLQLSKQAELCDESIQLRIDVVKPVSNMKDYEIILGMLELSIDKEFTLSEKDYKKYVLDEWDWKNQFEFAKTSYGL